jgi:hypothetical protein
MSVDSEPPMTPEPDRTVRVELSDRATRTYVGWLESPAGSAMYERGTGGTWHTSSGQLPADTELNELLEFLLMQAIAKRAPTLRGMWAGGGPQLLSDQGGSRP